MNKNDVFANMRNCADAKGSHLEKKLIRLNKKEKNSKARMVSIFALLFVIAIWIPFPSKATQENIFTKKENVDNKIVQENIKKENLRQEISKTMEQVLELSDKINEKEIQIQKLQIELDALDSKIANKKAIVQDLEQTQAKKEKVAKKRLVYRYKTDPMNMWTMLLQSKDLPQFLSNYYLLERITQLDNNVLQNVKNHKKQMENILIELKEFERVQKVKKEKIEHSKKLQENFIVLKNAKIQELSKEEKDTIEGLSNLQKEKLEIEKEIARMAQTYKPIERYFGGTFVWPVPSAAGNQWITARFGDGYANGYPGPKHGGVDIAIPSGEVGKHVAVAAQDGRVILAMDAKENNTGYGNYIILDHGGGIYTLYGHANSLIAKKGDFVKKGQPILYVGSTGNSTGPHLHFEVRLGGSDWSKRVDPLPYITTPKEPKV